MDKDKKNDIISIIKLLLQVNIDENFLNVKEFQEFMMNSKILYLKISHFPSSNRILLCHNESKTKEVTEKEVSLFIYKNSEKEMSYEHFFQDVDIVYNRSGEATIISNEIEFSMLPKIRNVFKDDTRDSLINYFSNFKEKIKNVDKKIRSGQIQNIPVINLLKLELR